MRARTPGRQAGKPGGLAANEQDGLPHRRRDAAAHGAARANGRLTEDRLEAVLQDSRPRRSLPPCRRGESRGAACERRRRHGQTHARIGPSRPRGARHGRAKCPGRANGAPQLTSVADRSLVRASGGHEGSRSAASPDFVPASDSHKYESSNDRTVKNDTREPRMGRPPALLCLPPTFYFPNVHSGGGARSGFCEPTWAPGAGSRQCT